MKPETQTAYESILSMYTPLDVKDIITNGAARCEGAQCGDIVDNDPASRYNGWCDKDGCDFNPYR